MKKLLIPTLVILVVAILVYLSVSTGESPEEYAAVVAADRKKKEDFLKNDPQSPFRDKIFQPLSYFEPDLAYRVNARLEEVAAKQVRVLATSTGEEARYLDYAWAIFDLQGKEHRLLILEIMEMGPNRGKLFLAFADESSARETYGGGRYLDLKKVPAATSVELDFNLAYNPYCAYNSFYSCPLPPRENLLGVPIRAGEKAFKSYPN
jgi:hypothetical protein